MVLLLPFNIFLSTSCKDSSNGSDVGPDVPAPLTEWAPVGAKWYYTLSCINGPSPSDCDTYYTIESVKDSTVNPGSVQARILKVQKHNRGKAEALADEITYGDLNKVYHYDKHLDAFYLLYDFTAGKGDTLKIRTSDFTNYWGNVSNQFIEVVKEVASFSVNGQDLKQYTTAPVVDTDKQLLTEWTYATGGHDATVVQGIGSMYWMFGGDLLAVAAQHGHLGLRCFEVRGKVVYKDPLFDLDCDYTDNN